MGQGLAPAEPATSAAASCLLRRRRRAIGAIVVCGPFLGCPFDECGAHRVRRRTCLPSAFDMNAGLKFGFGGHRQIVPIPKDTRRPIWQTRSPGIARGRLGMRTSRRSIEATRFIARRAERSRSDTYRIIRTVSELGSDVCAAVNRGSSTQGICTNRREATRSEHAHRRATRIAATMLASTSPLPGPSSASP